MCVLGGMQRKPGRRTFSQRSAPKPAIRKKPAAAPKPATRKKPASATPKKRKRPAARPSSPGSALRAAKRGAFVVHLKHAMTDNSPESASKIAGKASGTQHKDRERYMERLEQESRAAGNSPGITAEKLDPRFLDGNQTGAGRPSAWDTKSRERLINYLLSRPKAGSGVAQWPSTNVLAGDEKLQKKLKLPAQTQKHYAAIAAEEGLHWVGRYSRSFLTGGMVKRRIAMAAKYKNKTATWWKGVAFQDEGHADPWQTGPGHVWARVGDEPETKAKVKGRGGTKINFSVLFSHGAKAPLYTYEDNFATERSLEMIKHQWLPFFKANPKVKRLITDGDKCHPGNGATSSLAVNKFFRENCPGIEIISAENIWDKDGNKLTGAQLKSATTRSKAGKATAAGHVWTANSPDLNPAEHAVAGIVDKTKMAMGSYTLADLKKMVKQRWREYAQDSLDASIASMPNRLSAVERRAGGYLLKGQDY